VLGDGPLVVLLNDSGNDVCPWMGLARDLTRLGRSVAVFTYSSPAAAGERDAVREALAVARAGPQGMPYVLIGASLGGRVVFEAAARAPRGLAGIVSLSGERRVEDYRDILADVRQVRAPVLYLGSREDALIEGARQPRRLRSVLRSAEERFLLVPGFDHGTELLDGAGGPRIRRAIERFVRRHP
jgi:pimeloyl-ACP methyl ester carboxylesterase